MLAQLEGGRVSESGRVTGFRGQASSSRHRDGHSVLVLVLTEIVTIPLDSGRFHNSFQVNNQLENCADQRGNRIRLLSIFAASRERLGPGPVVAAGRFKLAAEGLVTDSEQRSGSLASLSSSWPWPGDV
jgi:hypothetical protein